ncbi:MAG: TetR/AcrR family transcriptional regulator [Bacteroidota bacterium]
MNETERPWIDVGYRLFAYNGPGSLRIERISKKVGKNKSSFYHLFADLEGFIQRLLNFHVAQGKNIAIKEAEAKDEQELIEIIIHHKVDLLFNRQLRFHRENPDFEFCVNKINAVTIPALLPLWKKIIGLSENSHLAEMVLMLSIENFYLQITDLTINEEWLTSYFKGIRTMVAGFKHGNTMSNLDGSV